MSYEEKYMKYKQKYLELKEKINMMGKNENVSNTTNQLESEMVLSDTPTNVQTGGYAISNGSPVSNITGVPNAANCAGSVNSQPKVTTPVVPQNNTAVVPPATAPITDAPAPASTNSKNLSNSQSDEATTTELKSDVEQIFNQLGGHEHYDPFETRFDDNDSVSSSDIEDSSDASDSASDMDAVYSPIASDSLPPGQETLPAGITGPARRTGLNPGDAAPFQ